MLASAARQNEVRFDDVSLFFERKYDGIRCLASASPQGQVHLRSRNGLEKAAQFPTLAGAVSALSDVVGPLILDGEIVALDVHGDPTSFTLLQQALPPTGRRSGARSSSVKASLRFDVRYFVFDILRYADSDLRGLPLSVRRDFLARVTEQLPAQHGSCIEISRAVKGNGEELWRRAQEEGWEGLVVKGSESVYTANARSAHWRKLKVTQTLTFLVGGYSEMDGKAGSVGSLALGLPIENGLLRPVGSVGSGLTADVLDELTLRLHRLATSHSPFAVAPTSLKAVKWVRPAMAVMVRFSEWTPAGSLRHPVFLSWKDADEPQNQHTSGRPAKTSVKAASATQTVLHLIDETTGAEFRRRLCQTLQDLEDRKVDGLLGFGPGTILKVSNLAKPFWTQTGWTKGDLLRHYVKVSPLILPVVADRALVMKRHPNGAAGEAFYQHRAPDPLPKGARAVQIPGDDVPARLVGGDLFTLLYMAQLGSISQDPWFSKIDSTSFADYVAFDLDPMPGVAFERVRDVALWLHEALFELSVPHFVKTSGAAGLHIHVPLQPQTAYEPARLFTQIVATLVSGKHPKVATVERSVNARGSTVYIDYLQNIEGKTLACAYSARASEFGGVSTPLSWEEVQDGAKPEDFTIKTIGARLRVVGDLWAPCRDESNALRIADALASLSGSKKRGPR